MVVVIGEVILSGGLASAEFQIAGAFWIDSLFGLPATT
jgi:hypothetical protein